MDPILTIALLVFFIWGGGMTYFEKVALPNKQRQLDGVRKVHSERLQSEKLALETKRAQDAALTLEDKIWLYDNGRTEWDPDYQPDVEDVLYLLEKTKYNRHDEIDELDPLEAYWWDLPKWYVDFLTTRPHYSDLAQMFYDWACEGKDVNEHLASMKAEHDRKIDERTREIEKAKAERKERNRIAFEKEQAQKRAAEEQLKAAILRAAEEAKIEAREKKARRHREAMEREEKGGQLLVYPAIGLMLSYR